MPSLFTVADYRTMANNDDVCLNFKVPQDFYAFLPRYTIQHGAGTAKQVYMRIDPDNLNIYIDNFSATNTTLYNREVGLWFPAETIIKIFIGTPASVPVHFYVAIWLFHESEIKFDVISSLINHP